ncbi:hypothetical protein [Virgibacillus sp. L01]
MTATTSTHSKIKKVAQSFSFIAWKKEQIKKGAILTDSSDRLLTT